MLKQLKGFLFSNEIFFVLFLLSGTLKTFFLYFSIPTGFDLTILTSIILGFLILYDLYKNKYRIRYNNYIIYASIAMISIFYVILLSFTYSSSDKYIYEKTIQFITLIIAFFSPILLKNFSAIFFLRILLTVIIIMSVIYLPFFLKSYDIFIHDYKHILDMKEYSIYQSYLTMGYLMGLALIINIFSNFYSKKIKLLVSLFLFSSLVITGARGPIIFFLFVLLLFSFFNVKNIKKKTIKNLTLLIIPIVVILVVFNDRINSIETIQRSFERLIALTDYTSDSASTDRLERFNFVFEKLDAKHILFGYGFGSYGYEKYGVDVRSYPHNIFLELLFELGIVALIIYMILLLIIFLKIYRVKNFMLFALFIYIFLNSMKSLSLADSRIMIAIFSIILLYDRTIKVEK